jgi:hypothetical protein
VGRQRLRSGLVGRPGNQTVATVSTEGAPGGNVDPALHKQVAGEELSDRLSRRQIMSSSGYGRVRAGYG